MFENVSGKIKSFAQFQCVIGGLVSGIYLLVSLINGTSEMSILIAIGCFISIMLYSWILYGLGELFENIRQIKESVTGDVSNDKDELPKL